MTLVRRFNKFHVLEELAQKPGWWRDLLRSWAPAGSPLTPERRLRVGIGDNELRFYHKGCRIACVKIGQDLPNRNVPKLTVSPKYVFDNFVGPQTGATMVGQRISCGSQEDDYVPGTGFASWIERARIISKNKNEQEKPLIEDRVLAFNQHVVDLEIRIPDGGDQKDLAVLEQAPSETIKLVFWEAKTAHSNEARSNSAPAVILQLSRYRESLERNAAGIVDAYAKICVLLQQLHTLAVSVGGTPIPQLSEIIRKVADGSAIGLDPLPRLLVLTEETTAAGKDDKQHRNKVREAGYPVLFDGNGPVVLDHHASKQAWSMET